MIFKILSLRVLCLLLVS